MEVKLNPEPKRSLSNFEVEEKAANAYAIMNSQVFISAMEDIYSEAAGTLLKADVGSLTATTAHATMKAVSQIRSKLESYVNDHKMRQKFPKELENG